MSHNNILYDISCLVLCIASGCALSLYIANARGVWCIGARVG